MRPASRPAHYRLTPAEQAQNDAEHQRGREIGMLGAVLLIISPFLVISVAQVIAAVRGL